MPDPLRRPPTPQTADLLFQALKLDGFFPELTPEHVEKLFPRSGLYEYPAGCALLRQGDEPSDLFVVCDGAVEIVRDGARVASLGQGAIVGEISYLVGGRRTATATALSSSTVFRLAFADIEYTFKHNPRLAEHLRGLARARQSP